MTRKTTWLVATATAAAAVPAFAGTAAVAAPAAQARACNDNNDARVVASAVAHDATLYLLYSGTCRTAWAKVSYPGVNGMGQNGEGFGAAVIRSDGTTRTCDMHDGWTACTTAHLSDAGYTSYAKAYYRPDSGYTFWQTSAY